MGARGTEERALFHDVGSAGGALPPARKARPRMVSECCAVPGRSKTPHLHAETRHPTPEPRHPTPDKALNPNACIPKPET